MQEPATFSRNYEAPVDVALLLPDYSKKQKETSDADPVAVFIADFLATFGLNRLPEQLGVMHLLYRLIQASTVRAV